MAAQAKVTPVQTLEQTVASYLGKSVVLSDGKVGVIKSYDDVRGLLSVVLGAYRPRLIPLTSLTRVKDEITEVASKKVMDIDPPTKSKKSIKVSEQANSAISAEALVRVFSEYSAAVELAKSTAQAKLAQLGITTPIDWSNV